MATLYNSDLKPLESGTYTHYYDHATKLFLADNFRLAPKQTFLYYVCINVDVSALQSILGVFGSESVSSQTLIEQYETGLLAKRVELPRFNVNTKTFNAYNRKNIVQTNLRYDPLNITFHDDAADTVTKFWNDFYTYYYRDSDYDPQLYTVPHKYQPRSREGWGFSPRNGNLKPFLRNIQIFSLHNKRFTEYLLINPVITAWRHGEHNSSESNGLMEATMTVEFETVKYRTGYVNPVDVNGFATIHYDNTPSPISDSITNIYTDSGIIGAITEGSTDLARPDGTGSGSGLLGSILNAYRFYNNVKDINVESLGGLVLGQIGAQVLGGAINGASQNIFFPTLSSTPGYGTTYASSSLINQNLSVGNSGYSSPSQSTAVTINTQPSAIISGATTSFSSAVLNDFTRGIQTNARRPSDPGSTANYPVRGVTQNITLDALSAQPATDEIYTSVTDAETGEIISRFKNVGNQAGGFDPADPNKNAEYIVVSTDQNNQSLTRRQYTNGDIVTFNEDGSVYSVTRGFQTGQENINTAPVNTRDQAAAGQAVNPTSLQYYTDPSTGITQVVNGGVSGLFRNTLSGAAGTLSGLFVGSELYGGISDAFGGGIIGKTLGIGVGGAVGAGFGIGVNNLFQTGLNKVLGTPTQVFDTRTGTIQNTGEGLVGTGAFTSKYPDRNIKSYVDNGNGTTTLQTFDGGSANINNINQSLVNAVQGTFSGLSNFISTLGQNQDSSVLLPQPGISTATTADGSPLVDSFSNPLRSVLSSFTPTNLSNLPVVDSFGGQFSSGSNYDETFLSSIKDVTNWDNWF